MNNGVSKKLCITIIGIQAVVNMAQGSTDKFNYACLIAGIVIVYKIVQAVIDYRRDNGKET